MSNRNRISPQTIALSGLMSALAVVLLYLAGIIPSGWFGVTAVAGLVVAVVVSAAGYLPGIMCYLVTSILALLLVPAKQVSVLFLCMFGLYPLLKIKLERIKFRVLEYILKLVYCNLVILVLYHLAFALLFGDAAEKWQISFPLLPAVMAAGSAVFLLYDYAFSKVMSMLQNRLIPHLRRIFNGC